MKKLSFIMIVLVVLYSCKKSAETVQQANQATGENNAVASCQATLTCTINSAAMVQKDSATGVLLYVNTNYANYPVFKTEKWAWPGHRLESRSLLKFNLPSNFFTGFNFCQAYLVLKEYPDPNSPVYIGVANPYYTTQVTNNAVNIVRVKSNWSQSSVTWNTQPIVSYVNAASAPLIATGSGYLAGSDQPIINVTQMMQDVKALGIDYGLEISTPANTPPNVGRQLGARAVPVPLRARLVFYY